MSERVCDAVWCAMRGQAHPWPCVDSNAFEHVQADSQVFDPGDSERERMLAKISELQRELAAEREACAQVAEDVGRRWLGRGAAAFAEVAAAIRARGGKAKP